MPEETIFILHAMNRYNQESYPLGVSLAFHNTQGNVDHALLMRWVAVSNEIMEEVRKEHC